MNGWEWTFSNHFINLVAIKDGGIPESAGAAKVIIPQSPPLDPPRNHFISFIDLTPSREACTLASVWFASLTCLLVQIE